jgi:hypothetical protein
MLTALLRPAPAVRASAIAWSMKLDDYLIYWSLDS